MKKSEAGKFIGRGLLAILAANLVLLLASHKALAALVVNRSIITFENSAVNREDVVVINSSNQDNLYVQVDPYVVVNPGDPEQTLEPLLVTDNPEFLVTPNRLVTPPGGRSIVRFLNLRPAGDMERVYRVNMIPITPPVELEDSAGDAVNSQLEVVVAYQILVIVLPVSPNPVVSLERDAKTAVFSNTGNANYLLTDGQQCNPVNLVECVPLADHRVYPGNEWQLELPFDGAFTYKVRTQTGLRTELFR